MTLQPLKIRGDIEVKRLQFDDVLHIKVCLLICAFGMLCCLVFLNLAFSVFSCCKQ